MGRLAREGTVEPVSRDQILRRERGQRNNTFPCSADHEQDCKPYLVDPYSCYICGDIDYYCCRTDSASRFTSGGSLVVAGRFARCAIPK